MTSHDSQTGEEPADATTGSEEEASFVRKHVTGGTAAIAVGGLSLVRALRALGTNSRRAAFHGALGAAGIALGIAQRQRSDADGTSPTGLNEGETITFENQDDENGGGMDEGEATGTSTDELSSSTPDEAREDDGISEAAVANEPAEAAGPSSTDSVPEQTDSTEPEATPEDDPEVDEEVASLEDKDERTTPGEKADTPEEEIAEETDDGDPGEDEATTADETTDDDDGGEHRDDES
ncbi:hypothetical protein [Natronoarchaeum rubrum]|uniref:hypothetical protein n=1 Tax=Natronoarchaeum rubrum TaxID=755311 RepID=UPI0021122122|nr:hypothetical protein [Natronoarchaeum rubrum]